MQKIPTMFVRDWAGDRSRVTREVSPGCEWVIAGEGVATQKLDGTCCMVRDRKLFKRRELRAGDPVPSDFEQAGHDDETGKTVGWVPVGDGPDDKYHREAFDYWLKSPPEQLQDGTYELLGPKIQGNPEKWPRHGLVYHNGVGRVLEQQPDRTFDALYEYLKTRDIEGIVFHHDDGRMAKIKKRDFGLKRTPLKEDK